MPYEIIEIRVKEFVPRYDGNGKRQFCKVQEIVKGSVDDGNDRITIHPWRIADSEYWIIRVNGVKNHGGSSKSDLDFGWVIVDANGLITPVVKRVIFEQKPTCPRAGKDDPNGAQAFLWTLRTPPRQYVCTEKSIQ